MASSTSSLPPPSPSPLAQPPKFSPKSQGQAADETQQPPDPLADIPDLSTTKAETDDDRAAGLRLVADSVAQQRQQAARAVIFHPLSLSAVVALLAMVINILYKGNLSDWALVGTTGTGVVMAVLISVRWAVGGYVDEAERVGTWAWLNGGRDNTMVGKEDDVLLTRFGNEVIGAIVFRGVREAADPGPAGPKKSRRQPLGASAKANSGVRAVIRAWTVKQRYRGRGVGTGLLEEVIKVIKERGWGAGIGFADDHANSKRILWPIFNASFERGERRARECLEKLLEREQESTDAGIGAGVEAKRRKK
jgi:ribosomal protein S18 acetylase RimI-like enzyme